MTKKLPKRVNPDAIFIEAADSLARLGKGGFRFIRPVGEPALHPLACPRNTHSEDPVKRRSVAEW